MRRTPVVMLLGGLAVAAAALLVPDVLQVSRLWGTPEPELVWMSAEEFAYRHQQSTAWFVARSLLALVGLGFALLGAVRLSRRR